MSSTTHHETTIEAVADLPLIRIVREFDAPRENVFRAHTDPDLVAQWLGPRRLEMKVDHYDAVTGGSYRYTHVDTDGTEHKFAKTVTRTCFYGGFGWCQDPSIPDAVIYDGHTIDSGASEFLRLVTGTHFSGGASPAKRFKLPASPAKVLFSPALIVSEPAVPQHAGSATVIDLLPVVKAILPPRVAVLFILKVPTLDRLNPPPFMLDVQGVCDPELPPMQVPSIAKQPSFKLIPPVE